MPKTSAFATSAGLVEVLSIPGALPPVRFFPGGHCSAECDCGWSLYQDMGHAIVSFSRPGAVLVELDSPSHIFWIGPGRAHFEIDRPVLHQLSQAHSLPYAHDGQCRFFPLAPVSTRPPTRFARLPPGVRRSCRT